MKTTCTIYSIPEVSQTVQIDFEYRIDKGGWFSNSPELFLIERCNVLTPLALIPSDIEEDLRVGIAYVLGVDDPTVIRFDCKVEVSYGVVLIEKEYPLEMMFV